MNAVVDAVIHAVIRAFVGRIAGFDTLPAGADIGRFTGRITATAMRCRILQIRLTAIGQIVVTIRIAGITR